MQCHIGLASCSLNVEDNLPGVECEMQCHTALASCSTTCVAESRKYFCSGDACKRQCLLGSFSLVARWVHFNAADSRQLMDLMVRWCKRWTSDDDRGCQGVLEV